MSACVHCGNRSSRSPSVLAYQVLPGRPLLGGTPGPDAALWLGRFLREMHGAEPAGVADVVPIGGVDPREWLDDLEVTRIKFFARGAALDDLAYGRDHRRREYAHAAEGALIWLFDSPS